MQGLLSKMGLGQQPGQPAAPGTPAPGQQRNPWLASPAPSTANPPSTPQAQPQDSGNTGFNSSILMQLFHGLMGKNQGQ